MHGVALALLIVLMVATAASARQPTATPSLLRIESLSGSVVRLGTWSGYAMVGVRLRPRLCVGSRAEALRTFPREITVTHYQVSRSRKRWTPVRTAIDRPRWLVPFGETWSGACGTTSIEEPIPPGHYDAVSLGNPLACYGVRLTIKAGDKQASKRLIIKCGGLGR